MFVVSLQNYPVFIAVSQFLLLFILDLSSMLSLGLRSVDLEEDLAIGRCVQFNKTYAYRNLYMKKDCTYLPVILSGFECILNTVTDPVIQKTDQLKCSHY